MMAATINVATQVTWSNCLEDLTGSRLSTKFHAASIVARNTIDQYNDKIGAGENIAANVAKHPYTIRRRDGEFPNR
jgi:hypothetical protein